MAQRNLLTVLGVIFLFVSNSSNAEVLCAKLKGVSAGEFHTLAITDNNSLLACGDNSFGQTGWATVFRRFLFYKG